MQKITEFLFSIGIFLSPVFMATLLIGILSSVWDFHAWYCLLLVPGAIAGFLWAGRVGRKHGASQYLSRLMETPDIEETWERERRRNANRHTAGPEEPESAKKDPV